MMIPTDQYKEIIEVLPILCVDIIVINPKGEYLLIKRANDPLKGQWWVVGGRVLKGETLEQAAIRKAAEEVGLEITSAKPIGYYEDAFEKNIFGSPTPLHSVSVVFSARIGEHAQVRLDTQSSEWKYSNELPNQFCIKSFVEKEY